MSLPPIFKPLSFEAAEAAAHAESRCLLLDFTADWCAPCKHMEKTTWRAPEVEAWVGAHAVAVQIDIDQQEALATRFGVRAVPTVVLLREGTELDRVTGGRAADSLVSWLEGALQGRTALDAMREAAGDSLDGRFSLGQELLLRGRPEEALDHLVWLWVNCLAREPAWVGVKHSFLAGRLEEAAKASPECRARLATLRDVAGTNLGEQERFSEWVTLNGILGEEARTLEWFDSVKAAPPEALRLDLNNTVTALLREHGRWQDLGRLTVKPLDQLRHRHQLVTHVERERPAQNPQLPPGLHARQLEHMRTYFRDEAAALVRALLAAARVDEADEVAAEAAQRDPSEEMRTALSDARLSPHP